MCAKLKEQTMLKKFSLYRTGLLVVLLSTGGCTSISSTFLRRHEDDNMNGISNGSPGIHNHARPFKGIPVTLKIPTHLDVAIDETLLFVEKPGTDELMNTQLSRRHLNVRTDIQFSDKIFTVDLKRPAAGSLDYDIEFQGEKNPQYFSKVGYHIVDETIKDITAVITGLTPTTKKPGESQANDATPPPKPADKVIQSNRTVAWKRFDLHAADFEDQVLLFVNHHLNNCHSCGLIQSTDSIPTEVAPDCLIGGQEVPMRTTNSFSGSSYVR
jgi:hypothetical protein